MAHHAYIRGPLPADWATGTTVTQAHFAGLDVAQYGSIDGDTGGTWSPAAAISLVGTKGLVLGTGTPFVTHGDTYLEAPTCVIGTTPGTDYLDVRSNSEFKADVILGTGDTDALTVRATSNFTSPVTLGYSAGTSGDQILVKGDLSIDTDGRFTADVYFPTDTDVTTTYRYEIIYVTVSIARNLTITVANPRHGTTMFFHALTGAGDVTVTVNGATLVGTFGASVSRHAKCVYNATGATWYLIPL
jgi:hypothetical protein